MENELLCQSVSSCIKFIIKNQNRDGSFDSLSSSNHQYSKPEIFKTTFYTSLILGSISKISDKRLEPVKNKAKGFLLSQKEESATYNYWANSFVKYKTESCPNDLDDTSCALSALISTDRHLVTESDLAKITQVLIELESAVGGPYYTWILPKECESRWKDVDLAVNANIAYFLSMLGIRLPQLDALIENAIKKRKFVSTYYPSLSTIYFIARYYDGKHNKKLTNFVLQKNQRPFRNPLDCALLGLSLLNLKEHPRSIERNIRYLLAHQKSDGSFGTQTFINERTFSKTQKRFSGSEALTTALVLELIVRCQNFFEKLDVEKKYEDVELTKEVTESARKIIADRFSTDFVDLYDNIIHKIISSDPYDNIALQPLIFTRSLKVKTKLDRKFLLGLAQAGIFGWIAYTVFDNISDEKKDLDKFSLALVCYRELGFLFSRYDSGFNKIFSNFLDRVEYANFYEYKQAIPDNINKKKIYSKVSDIAEKSIAHSLVPLAILSKLGYGQNSSEFKALQSFYKNYLVARQLNDDAHDWEIDLNHRKINYAGEQLTNDFKEKYNRAPEFSKDKVNLQKLFWDKTIIKMCRLIKKHITKAKEDRAELSHLLKDYYLEDKLEQLLLSANKAIEVRKETKKYLKTLDF